MNNKFSIDIIKAGFISFVIACISIFLYTTPAAADILLLPTNYEPKLSMMDRVMLVLLPFLFFAPLFGILFLLFSRSCKEIIDGTQDKVRLSADTKTEVWFIIANFVFFSLLIAALEYLCRYYVTSNDTCFKAGMHFYDRSTMFFTAAFVILMLSILSLWRKINLKILRHALIILSGFYFVVFLIFRDITATLSPAIEINKLKLIALRDCERIAYNVRKFNSLEGTTVQDKYMKELIYKNYVPELKNMRDPWRCQYRLDYLRGVVYSGGENTNHRDGQILCHKEDPYDYTNADDVFADYAGPLTIVEASLDVNPEGGDFKASTNPVEIAKCYDVLNLGFNKAVLLPSKINLGLAVLPAAEASKQSGSDDAQTTANQIFKYFMSEDKSAEVIMAPADLAAATGEGAKVYYYRYDQNTDSYKNKIAIRFAPGFTCADPSKKLLTPRKYYINIAGSSANPNKLFVIYDKRIEDGKRTVMSYDERAIAAEKNILIR